MSIDSLRTAVFTDAEAIAQLVNRAYRPAPEKAGWTHESDLVRGDRTDTTQIESGISKPHSAILLGLRGPQIVGCVHVQKEGRDCHIGLLAVDPPLQKAGIGKKMLAYAERYAAERFACEKFVMAVVLSRHELISFYLRRGYRRTGQIMEYPRSANAGVAMHADLKIERLEKRSDLFPEPS